LLTREPVVKHVNFSSEAASAGSPQYQLGGANKYNPQAAQAATAWFEFAATAFAVIVFGPSSPSADTERLPTDAAFAAICTSQPCCGWRRYRLDRAAILMKPPGPNKVSVAMPAVLVGRPKIDVDPEANLSLLSVGLLV